MKRFKLVGLDEGGVRSSNDNLRLVCLIEGGGKLAIWGQTGSRANIDAVLNAGTPCDLECECILPERWAARYGHSHWVPQGNTLRVLTGAR